MSSSTSAVPGRRFVGTFVAGIIFGFGFSFLLNGSIFLSTTSVGEWRLQNHLFSVLTKSSLDMSPYSITDGAPAYREPFGNRRNTIEVASSLKSSPKLLCWVMTNPKSHKVKAVHVKATWGKRCDKLLFMSSEADVELGAVKLSVEEGRNWLWGKTKEAFTYIWETYKDNDEYGWFMKADDDTYVIVENLKRLLSDYNPVEPIYFGAQLNWTTDVYMSGGPGYVLSKEALRRFVQEALLDKSHCASTHKGSEDLEMGRCLTSVGVKPADSRDNEGRHRFMLLGLGDTVFPNGSAYPAWYRNMMIHSHETGFNCCSDYPVSFHYVNPKEMYLFEYLIYHVNIF